jgi:hypothetical protein
MRGHYKNDIYDTNHINNLLSQFKEWIYPFHGVSTKFLANYPSLVQVVIILQVSTVKFVDAKI